MDRGATPEIGQCKGSPPVTAIRRAKQRIQRLILIDGQNLSVAQGPTARGKIETDNPYFGQEWF
jgi:hypothetical protein